MSHLVVGGSSGVGIKIKISPSAKAIFDLLETKKTPIPVKDIVKELPYSDRTVQYGLRQLQKHNLIMKRPNLEDLRESLYLLAPFAYYVFIK